MSVQWSANRLRTDWPRSEPAGRHPSSGTLVKIGPQSHVQRPILGITLPAVGDQLGLASIESWPAAGGGLLVGIAEPGLAGTAPLRSAIKTLFLHLDRGATVKLVVPYADLEPEASRCMVDLAAAELRLPPESIALDLVVDRSLHTAGIDAAPRALIDLGRDVELSISALAAVTRMLLTEAAAQVWGASALDCRVDDGVIRLSGTRHVQRYGEVTHLAALMPLPGSVLLGA